MTLERNCTNCKHGDLRLLFGRDEERIMCLNGQSRLFEMTVDDDVCCNKWDGQVPGSIPDIKEGSLLYDIYGRD